MNILSAVLSPSIVEVNKAVSLEVFIDDIRDYFFTADGYALKTADGVYFVQKGES